MPGLKDKYKGSPAEKFNKPPIVIHRLSRKNPRIPPANPENTVRPKLNSF